MKRHLLATALLLPFCALAQEGYIKFHNQKVLHGYVNRKVSGENKEHVIEFLKSENDPAPQHFRKADIYEYAIKHDTFRILKNFYPFELEGFHFDHVDARVLKSGKVDLLGIDTNHEKFIEHSKSGKLHHVIDHTLDNIPFLYVLHEESDQYLRGVPSKKDKFREMMIEFFSEDAVDSYENSNGELHFRHLEMFVERYNKNY